MQIFRILGAIFIGLSVVLIAVAVLPMLLGGGGALGGFAVLESMSIVVFTLLPLGIIFFAVGTALTRLLGPSTHSLRGGVAATATVRATRPTSMRVNGRPVLRIDLELAVPGRPPMPVSVRRVVPAGHLLSVAPGAVLAATADPADPRRFAIDWDRVRLQGGASSPLEMLAEATGGAFDPSELTDQLGRMGINLDPLLHADATAVGVDGPMVVDVRTAANDAGGPTPGRPVPLSALLGTAPVAAGAQGPATLPGAWAGGVAAAPGASTPGLGAVSGTWASGPGGVPAAAVPVDAGTLAAAGVAGTGATVDVTGATLSALRAAGVPGRGVIREATDLGIAIGEGRLYRLRLDVIPGDRPGYPVEHVELVPSDSLWRMVTGVTVPLFLDRAQPGRIAVDWSA